MNTGPQLQKPKGKPRGLEGHGVRIQANTCEYMRIQGLNGGEYRSGYAPKLHEYELYLPSFLTKASLCMVGKTKLPVAAIVCEGGLRSTSTMCPWLVWGWELRAQGLPL